MEDISRGKYSKVTQDRAVYENDDEQGHKLHHELQHPRQATKATRTRNQATTQQSRLKHNEQNQNYRPADSLKKAVTG
jgi:hypothetical protein